MIARILIAAGALSLAVAGKAPIAKLLLALHLPSLAAPLLDDPAIKGVALYRAGDYQAADLTFRAAGRGSTYNRGLSLATQGDFPLSQAYFDAVLFSNPADSQARENRNYVTTLFDAHRGEANAAGRIAAEVVAVSGGSPVDEIKRLGRPLDQGQRVADAEWLAALPDDPGEFLALRLEAEHKRRMALGLAPAEEAVPW